LLIVGAGILLAACQGQGQGGAHTIDRFVENRLTITAGLYGQAAIVSDVGAFDEFYWQGLEVDLYGAAPEPGVAPTGIAVTDAHGFFELATDGGPAWLCARDAVRRCTSFSLVTGELRRLDFTASIIGVWSGGVPWPPTQ
jgi:hypothetical protein